MHAPDGVVAQLAAAKPFGFVRSRAEMVNQKGETVVALVGVTMVKRRAEALA